MSLTLLVLVLPDAHTLSRSAVDGVATVVQRFASLGHRGQLDATATASLDDINVSVPPSSRLFYVLDVPREGSSRHSDYPQFLQEIKNILPVSLSESHVVDSRLGLFVELTSTAVAQEENYMRSENGVEAVPFWKLSETATTGLRRKYREHLLSHARSDDTGTAGEAQDVVAACGHIQQLHQQLQDSVRSEATELAAHFTEELKTLSSELRACESNYLEKVASMNQTIDELKAANRLGGLCLASQQETHDLEPTQKEEVALVFPELQQIEVGIEKCLSSLGSLNSSSEAIQQTLMETRQMLVALQSEHTPSYEADLEKAILIEKDRCDLERNLSTLALETKCKADVAELENALHMKEGEDWFHDMQRMEYVRRTAESAKEIALLKEEIIQQRDRHSSLEGEAVLSLQSGISHLVKEVIVARCSFLCDASSLASTRDSNCTAEITELQRRIRVVDQSASDTDPTQFISRIEQYFSPEVLQTCRLSWQPPVWTNEASFTYRLVVWMIFGTIKLIAVGMLVTCILCSLQQGYDVTRLRIENASLKDKLKKARSSLRVENSSNHFQESNSYAPQQHASVDTYASSVERFVRTFYRGLQNCHQQQCELLFVNAEASLLVRSLVDHREAPEVTLPPTEPPVAPVAPSVEEPLIKNLMRGYFRTLERYHLDLMEAVLAREHCEQSLARAAAWQLEQQKQRERKPLLRNTGSDPHRPLEQPATQRSPSVLEEENKWKAEAEGANHLVRIQRDAIKVLEEQLDRLSSAPPPPPPPPAPPAAEVDGSEWHGRGSVEEYLRARLLQENREKHELRKELSMLRLEGGESGAYPHSRPKASRF